MIKIKNGQYPQWAMLQKLPVNNFEWMKDTSQFDKHFIKDYNEESDNGFFSRSWCSIYCKITWPS